MAGKLPRAAAARWRGGQGGGDDPSQLHPVNGIRLQKPGASVEHVGNVVVVKGRGKGTMMRGLWMVPGQASGPGLVFRGNRVKLIAEDREAEGYALSAGGVAEPGEDATVQLADNVVLTNLCHVQFGDNYSHGGRYRFLSNRFVRLGDDPRYRTIRMGWRGWKYESFGHTFVDTVFGGGAGYDSVSFDGAQRGRYDFDVGWTLELRSDPGAEVTVTDATGAVAFTGRVPPGGALAIPLVAYRRSRAGQGTRRLTPHTVVVEGAARRATRDVTMDGPKTLELRP